MNDDQALREQIPELAKANDMRNFLTHAYLHIDDLVVWNAVTEELPRLLQDIEAFLSRPDA